MNFPEIKELQTADLILRKVKKEDAQLYYERLGSREAVTRYMLFMPHKDISESIESVENVLRRYETGKCYRWAIALKTDNSIIGIIELLRFHEAEGTCSFAYMIGDAFWGRGYGTQTLKAVLDFAFSEMELSAVEADHMAANSASGAVMRKSGMVHVRTEKGKYEKNGQIYDAPVYRITREMWETDKS